MASNIPYELSDHAASKYFRETGTRQGWLPSESPVILAVSGGGDSIAMLWMFSRFYGGEITAVHVNHNIRGNESDGDERFTATFAGGLGVKFRAVRVDVPSAKMKGESLESSARRLRLQALTSTANELGITRIMLGHNRDDLAETVLFNILRGTGIRGGVGTEAGISPGHSPCQGANLARGLLQ